MKDLIQDDMNRCFGDGKKDCRDCRRRRQIAIDTSKGVMGWYMEPPARDGDKCVFFVPASQ